MFIINSNYKKILSKCFCKNKSDYVKIEYNKLLSDNDLSEYIDKSLGNNSLGLIVVKNIPDIYKLKENVLKNGFVLANKSEDYLNKLEKPESNFYVGWSKGRQYLDDGNDYMQASFYARISTETVDYDEETKIKYQNIWPNDINEFKSDFIKLGKIISNCQINLLSHLDKYIFTKLPYYDKKFLEKNFTSINDTVGLLATYYPSNIYQHKGSNDNWCGWHRDFGLLSGLCRPLFFNKNGDIIKINNTGLLVKDKQGNITEINYEDDEIVIQAADTLFILSGGTIISTPHSVKITQNIPDNVFRINYINFFEPNWNFELKPPGNMSFDEIRLKDPFKMSNVITNFRDGMNYKEFITETFSKFVK